MPTYDYHCPTCNSQQQLIQKITEKKAPECCGKEMETLIGAPAFVLKGTCWAKDGYTKK